MDGFSQIPEIPAAARTPLVDALLGIIAAQKDRITAQQNQIARQQAQISQLTEQVQQLRDEIARLKGHKPKPNIPPSALEKNPERKKWVKDSGEPRPGSKKRAKTAGLKISETIYINPTELPPGSWFKDYAEWTVQDLIIETRNTLYRLARHVTPTGECLCGELPPEVSGHFGATLRGFILLLHHQGRATQPAILEMLRDFGVDISAGALNGILTEGKEAFHAEKAEILRVGLEVSGHVNVDDTGARHKGKNGVCTLIGNEWFAWFESTESKSRINFLKLLGAGRSCFAINAAALKYMREQRLPLESLGKLSALTDLKLESEETWNAVLAGLGLTGARHVRIATEGALIGGLLGNGFNPDLAIISDDAGQFNVFLHGLCWIHGERTIHKLLGFNDRQRAVLEEARDAIWEFYRELKAYKLSPTAGEKARLEARFDEIFTRRYDCFATLTLGLRRLHKNRAELLLVLERPDVPLHNNTGESAIREYVTIRKISGSTRSDAGRMARDTFTSLKKTCRKLGVSLWSYLKDRLSGKNEIPRLGELIRRRAQLECNSRRLCPDGV